MPCPIAIVIAMTTPALSLDQIAERLQGYDPQALRADIALQFSIRHAGVRHPLSDVSPWYVLAELSDPVPGAMMAIFEAAMAWADSTEEQGSGHPKWPAAKT